MFLKKILKFGYRKFLGLCYVFNIKSIYEIPIIINNFNRFGYLEILINSLESRGYKNIIIIDNQSSYPPLLEYYKKSFHKIVYLDKNYGHKSLWTSGYIDKIKWNYFVYTDPDIVLVDDCPKNFMFFLIFNLTKFRIEKIGLGLKIDDLPDHYNRKKEVISLEKKYWEIPVCPKIFKAPVDTTFALYKPFTTIGVNNPSSISAYRTAGEYMAKHLPWYEKHDVTSEEDEFYIKNATDSSYWLHKSSSNQ